ncbi:hypothetical protein R6Q57_002784 [Mikania cordata]
MKNYGSQANWVRRNCIGKGSFGVVSLAVDESDGRFPFAVKSVNQNSGNLLRCLENEIRILKSLSSPYVVRYIGDDVTCELSTVYRNLHMEYIPNGTVAGVGKLTCGNANLRGYTRCIASALSYIHARNVVHCDVKGANVLIGHTPGAAKLADFGSAVELDMVSVLGPRGSPQWMAPEVVRGEYIGPESDVWSLGCTLIEMITGKPAWQDRGVDTLRQIGYSDDLPELEIPVPDDLRDFLNKCLKRDKSERWSCDQLLRHPFLLSCSVPSPSQITVDTCESSPRCVFDWSDSSSSEEFHQFNMMNRSTAEQRIGKLASNLRVKWESEGWETVRITGEASPECSDSVDGMGSWEDTESNASYDTDLESTTGNARSTMVDAMYRDTVDMYRCNMFVCVDRKIVSDIILDIFECYPSLSLYYTQWLTSSPSFLFTFRIFSFK